MGTLRHDRTSLWGDPRISEARILESLEASTPAPRRSRAPQPLTPRMATLLGLVGASLLASFAAKLAGLPRVARLFAYLTPPLVAFAVYEETQHRAREGVEGAIEA